MRVCESLAESNGAPNLELPILSRLEAYHPARDVTGAKAAASLFSLSSSSLIDLIRLLLCRQSGGLSCRKLPQFRLRVLPMLLQTQKEIEGVSEKKLQRR